MITLHCPAHLTETESWKERLEKMSVRHLIVASKKPRPMLREGNQTVEGVEAINAFLSQYEADVAGWNQDRCDMWFFDEP